MPLTHVCMWSGHGWRRITASEAARIHPGGTVSARSGLFMCELCGQYVSLTDGAVLNRYFKHSRYETSKNCPERTFGSSVNFYFSNTEKHLPLKMKIVSNNKIQFEIGFLSLPSQVLSKLSEYQISILPKNNGYDSEYRYSFSRLNKDSITYLGVGAFPAKEYAISSTGEKAILSDFWPEMVAGVNEKAVFDKATGKMIPIDGDVQVNRPYYVLTDRHILRSYKNVTQKEVCRFTKSWQTWRVYEVTATQFAEDPAKFFLELHCRLSEYPVDITPVWPPIVETPYLIYHKDDLLHFYLQGDAIPKVFPFSLVTKYPTNNGYYFSFNSSGRQQVLSAGRSQVLSYSYLWKNPLDYEGKIPKANITDIRGNEVAEGTYNILPERSTLIFKPEFDGFIAIRENEQIIEQIIIKAGNSLTYDSCKINTTIEVYQGLDCVWKIIFVRHKREHKDQKNVLRKLNSYKRNIVPLSHNTGSLAENLKAFPLIRQWLYKQIRKGYISKDALNLINTLIEE